MGTFPADQPLTPTGRLFLQPEMSTIIHSAIGVKHPIDMDSIKSAFRDSLMLKHPRFSSLLLRDKDGREYWRRTEIDLDRHLIIVDTSSDSGDSAEKAVNDYIADLSVSTPLSSDKPLWEIHFMLQKRCVIFRIHHALGDGISLMSMLLAGCRKAADPEAVPDLRGPGESRRDLARRDWGGVLVEFLKVVWYSLIFCLEFLLRCTWLRDRKTVISGGDGVELWPRRIATAKFLIGDMKLVKNAVANAVTSSPIHLLFIYIFIVITPFLYKMPP